MTRTILTAALLASLATPAFAGGSHQYTADEQVMMKVDRQMATSDGFGDPRYTADRETAKKWVTPAQCLAAIKDVADDAHVYTGYGNAPGAVKDANGDLYITGAQARTFCASYAKAYAHEMVETQITALFNDADMLKKPVDGMYESEAKSMGDMGKDCNAAVDAALAAGLPATEMIESKRYGVPAIALSDVKAKYCQPAIDWSQKQVGDIQAAAKAKQDAIAAVYKKAGIKGKRLDLFVSFGMPADAGFFVAGCEQYATTAAAMKKAKKLFVWLEGSDGYTIRTFTFHGDDYVETDHSYDTQAQAYRGCH